MKQYLSLRGHPFALGVAGLLLVLLAVGGVARVMGADEPENVFRDAGPRVSGTPVPLTAEQCVQAGLMLRASRDSTSAAMQANGTDPRRTGLVDEIERALAWVDRGCPPDPVRGAYPDPSGRGGVLRLLERSTFSEFAVISWEAPGAHPAENRQGQGPMNP